MKTFEFTDGKLVVNVDLDQDGKSGITIAIDPLEIGEEVWEKIQSARKKA